MSPTNIVTVLYCGIAQNTVEYLMLLSKQGRLVQRKFSNIPHIKVSLYTRAILKKLNILEFIKSYEIK